jgi:RNA polymerase primary sigma factor
VATYVSGMPQRAKRSGKEGEAVPRKPRVVEKSRGQRTPSPRPASRTATLGWLGPQFDPGDELTPAQMATLPVDGDPWPDAEAFLSAEEDIGDEWSDAQESEGTQTEATQTKAYVPNHDDLMRRYLREMGAFRRLTAAEEVALAKKIEEGRGAKRRKPPMSKAPVLAQMENISDVQGTIWAEELEPDEARAHMIRANLRLVVSIAKRFSGRGLSLLDLIQEGNLGLMKAVDRFDWRRGCRFGTYASWWIKQAIGRAIGDQGRIIRLPAHMADSVGRVHRLRQSWMQLYEEDPTAEELSKVARVPTERIEQIDQLTTPPLSIDRPLSDGERSVGDLLPDDSSVPPIDLLAQRERDRFLHSSLGELTARERRVLLMHFGIGQRRAYTLEEIGRKFQLTRERIRQIELKALKKLRHPCRRHSLGEFVGVTAAPEASRYGGEISVDGGS